MSEAAKQSGVVHVVDDDDGMRKSLLMLVETASLHAKGYASAEQFLEDMDQTQPACIVLDLRMPGMSGMELLRQLRDEKIDTPVIMISGHADVPTAVEGMKLGAVDFLQKPMEPKTLIAAIKRSIEISAALKRAQGEEQTIRQRFGALTPREMELLNLVVSGLANKQIARELGISIKTVANHRASLMAKTGASNAADLSRMYSMGASQRMRPHRVAAN
jgi:two-component system response regulator FixJ